MTQLRKRMIESLQLRGYSKRTQDCYVRSVAQLADYYHKYPDLITEVGADKINQVMSDL